MPLAPQPMAGMPCLQGARPITLDLNGSKRKLGSGPGHAFVPYNRVHTEAKPQLGNVDLVTYSQYVHGSILSVPHHSWSKENGESFIVSIYHFLRTFLGASGSSQEAIDLRIEQAMDLVKAHLMNAVRTEVDEMREKINKLEDTIAQLQLENEFLKANVPSDILVQLQQLQIQHETQTSPLAITCHSQTQ